MPPPQGDLTRARLVRAALELFTAQGYHVTTTPQLAKRAGIAEGTIYRHFESKQHLLNELYRGGARWAARLVKEAEAAGTTTPERFRKLAELLADGAVREPAVVRLFFFQDYAALLDEKSREANREFRTALEGLIAQGKADGSVRPGGADLWASAWLAVVRVALERILARDWGVASAGVRACADAGWDAIASKGERTAGERPAAQD
ncbi:MAG TPA: TetR/AcrR family transcriptional regulator [Gemmatimonadales bacterium]|nr:TetR/AcrR family transcriptional regulator [Gemmatimonadales bacterium]